VQKAVTLLCEQAGAGDVQAAKALIPWIDQALGKPTERFEHRRPTGLDELEFMSDEELARIVAQGLRERLPASKPRIRLGKKRAPGTRPGA
jgi:hypothetical protein